VVANALAATAACRAVGVPVKDIRAALAAFTPHQSNPGRGNLYAITSAGGTTSPTPILVDYGHNAAALFATGELVTSTWPGQPTAVVTLPGDRRDDLIAEAAEAIATWFGAVVIYEDDDLRGRLPGETRELIARAMRKARPTIMIKHAHGPAEALRAAMSINDGGPVLFIYEKHAAAQAALDAIGATAWPDTLRGDEPVSGQLIDHVATELVMDA
jgi:cyanophycin synthetase